MRYLSLLMMFVFLSGCRGQLVQEVDSSVVSQAVLIYSQQLKYEKHLHLEDSVIYYEDSIKKIRLDFSTQTVTAGLWPTRELLVDTVEGLLERINGNMSIVPFLDHYPFTADDLEIYIRFTTFYGKYIDLQDNALATLRNGNASYMTFTALDCSQDCWQERCEYYWQSKMFVDYYRQGESLYGPKPSELQTVFGVERFIPTSK